MSLESKHPSTGFPERQRSVRPAQVRSRTLLATFCIVMVGIAVVSAIVRACEGGDDDWDPPAVRSQSGE